MKLERKERLVFIQFDICEYYPSISEELLRKALDFAGRYTQISHDEKKVIYQARKTILFGGGKPWKKKSGDFDVPMGSWDGAEICDLVGLYLLSQLKNLDAKIGLHCDDGLLVCDLTARQAENLKKKLCKIFRDNGLSITVEANAKKVNFLDIHLDQMIVLCMFIEEATIQKGY